jgi:hypothetical protein
MRRPAMVTQIVEENAPRYHGPLPKPRGLLPVPPEIADEVTREQAVHQPPFTDAYAKLLRDDRTLVYYYEGEMVAYRIIPAGVEVLAAGADEVRKFLDETPPEEQQGVILGRP